MCNTIMYCRYCNTMMAAVLCRCGGGREGGGRGGGCGMEEAAAETVEAAVELEEGSGG